MAEKVTGFKLSLSADEEPKIAAYLRNTQRQISQNPGLSENETSDRVNVCYALSGFSCTSTPYLLNALQRCQ